MSSISCFTSVLFPVIFHLITGIKYWYSKGIVHYFLAYNNSFSQCA